MKPKNALHRLREHVDMTQAEVAANLMQERSGVSAIEVRDLETVRLGGLRRYVRACGFELIVHVRKGSEPPIRLL